MKGVGFHLEENHQAIVARYRDLAAHELGHQEPALKLAVPVLLTDLARAARKGEEESWRRAVLLALSQPEGGIRGLLQEFAVLRQALWEVLSSRGHAIPGDERRWVDRQLDEAAAYSAERWAAMARIFPAAPREAPAPTAKPPSPAPARPRTPAAEPRREAAPAAPPRPPRPPPLPRGRPVPPPLPGSEGDSPTRH